MNSLSVAATSVFFTDNSLCAFVTRARDIVTNINWQWHKGFQWIEIP